MNIKTNSILEDYQILRQVLGKGNYNFLNYLI